MPARGRDARSAVPRAAVPEVPKLSKTNFFEWWQQLRNLFFTMDWMPYIEEAEGEDELDAAAPDDPDDDDRLSWGAVIKALDTTTLKKYRRVGEGATAALLQRIRRARAGKSEAHIDLLESKMDKLSLDECGTFDVLATDMDNLYLALESAGHDVDEQRRKFQFLKKLPAEYNQVKQAIKTTGRAFGWDETVAHIEQWLLEEDNHDVPGGRNASIAAAADSSHATSEVCQAYLRGKCTAGARCKYNHPVRPAPAPPPLTHPEQKHGNDRKCTHCGKTGHLVEGCWALHPHLKAEFEKKRKKRQQAAAPSQAAPPDAAFATAFDKLQKQVDALVQAQATHAHSAASQHRSLPHAGAHHQDGTFAHINT